MANNWWWIWLAFVFFLLVLPLSYGAGYRRWGIPYPTYYSRRRLRRPVTSGVADATADGPAVRPTEEPAWGWIGDLVWLAFVIAVIWFLVSI
ncbi:MAG TPA: hypothetical protein VFA11_01630 [Acidimicrobiales bacterium]|nr:hypothetical protein [Acidimicrobiales bacterium]